MKIVHITAVFPPYRGGIGQVAYQCAKELHARGEDVEVVTVDYGDRPSFPFPVQYARPWIRWGKAGFCPQIAGKLSGYDIVQLHYPAFGLAEAVWWWKKRKRRRTTLVLFYHHDAVGRGILSRVFSWHRTFFLPRILRAADVVLVSSFDYARSSFAAPYLSEHPEKFAELAFGAESRFQPRGKDAAVVKSLHIQNGKKVILFVGGMDRNHYFKGVDVLLRAFSMGVVARTSILVLVGSGDMVPEYERLARALGIDDSVVFAQGVDDESLPAYYNSADVFVLPSIDQSEAFGIALVEAMACGVPVIASDLPGVRSVVQPGSTGWLVRPGDAGDLAEKLTAAVRDERELERRGKQGAQRVNAFYRWPKIIDRLLEIYSQKVKGIRSV